MECDRCREVHAAEGWTAETAEHAASCVGCREVLAIEASLIDRLERAGRAWRRGSVGASPRRRAAGRRAVAGVVRRRLARAGAVAAVLAVVGVASVLVLGPTSGPALAVMSRQVREAGTVRFVIEVPAGPLQSGTVWVSGRRLRLDLPNGDAIIADPEARRTALVSMSTRTVSAAESDGGSSRLYSVLLSLGEARRVESEGFVEQEGRAAELFLADISDTFDGMVGGGVARVWLDVSTRLPLRVEIPARVRGEDGSERDAAVVLRDFAFDLELPEALFETNPPGFSELTPRATTPVVGMEIGKRIRNLAMGVQMFMHDHEGAAPDRLEQLTPYVGVEGIRSPARPSEAIGFEYVKPTLPLQPEAVLAYERFAEGAEHVWVVLVDGSAHVITREELERRLGR